MSNSNQLHINTTYRIQNRYNNFTLDVSTADNHTVACWNNITGPNQKWILRNGNALENVYSKKFLALSNSGSVDAEEASYNWNLMDSQDNKTYMIYPLNNNNHSAFQQVTDAATNNNYTVAIGPGADNSHKWIFTPV